MADKTPQTTPTKVEKIPKDDSFKTCKNTMPTPGTRRELRMTAARESILSGGKPFKEAGGSSARKFNSHKRKANASSNNNSQRQINDTAGSNETFIRCEQELMFDRDSLEVAHASHKYSSTPKQNTPVPATIDERAPTTPPPLTTAPTAETELIASETEAEAVAVEATPIPKPARKESLSKQPTFLKEKNPKATNGGDFLNALNLPDKFSALKHSVKRSNLRPRRSPTKRSPTKKSPKKVSPRKQNKLRNMMPPPPQATLPRNNQTRGGPATEIKRNFVTPKPLSFKKPASLMGTASRYLSAQWNNSNRSLSRTQSFKSTAELERDYFSSLRSF